MEDKFDQAPASDFEELPDEVSPVQRDARDPYRYVSLHEEIGTER